MSQAGIVDVEGSHPQIPTLFVANVGSAVPIANTIELLGNAVSAHGVPLQTVASGNTVNFNVQYASAAASSVANNAGVASFNSADFTVDANGFVSASGNIPTSYVTDVGTAIPSGNILKVLATPNSGSTVKFSGSGNIIELNVSDSNQNTIIGFQAGNNSLSGNFSVGLGLNVLSGLTTGGSNSVVGYNAASHLTTGGANTVLGEGGLIEATTGSFNLILGYASGSNYTSSESSNILLSHAGVLGESNVIRIGTQGSGSEQQNKCFIAGIVGVTASNPQFVTINSSTGQLGVTSSAGEVAWTDEAVSFNAVANNGYFVTATATATLPASPSQGNQISFIVDGTQILTIQANTGQVIRIGTAVSASAGTAANNARGDSIVLVYRASDTAWISLGSPEGTWTVT